MFDDFELPDVEVPDVPDAPSVPDVPNVANVPNVDTGDAPDVPNTPDAPTGSTLPDVPTIPNTPNAPSPTVVQQAIADLNDNSDLDAVKGGPGATASTRDVGGESNTAKLAQQTISGQPNMSPAPGMPAKFTPEDFTKGAPTAGGGSSSGIIGSAMNWAKANPQLAAALVTAGAGAIGGAGKAALDKSSMERKTQLELANAEDLFAYKQNQSRDFSAAGTLQQPNVMQPAQGIINGGLKRPGGAGVFGPNGRLAR